MPLSGQKHNNPYAEGVEVYPDMGSLSYQDKKILLLCDLCGLEQPEGVGERIKIF